MNKLLSFLTFAIFLSTAAMADTTSNAKAALAQNTTNSFCSAGYNGANEEQYEQYKKDQYEGKCQSGMSYVECLRKSWSESK